MERAEQAVAKFSGGYNCAQAVLYSFCDHLGLDKDKALKIACGFGAGMARRGEVCGAVSGGIMVIGAKYGRGENDERKATEITYGKVREFMEQFSKIHGTCICRELLNGIELTTEEGQRSFIDNDYFNKVCKQCVRRAVEILETLL